MQTLILVGGLGTRLGSLARETGKPMVTIAGRPFLMLLIRQLALLGLTDIVLCVGYRAERIRACLADGRQLGVTIEYTVEDRPHGTAGAIRLAADRIRGDTFLITNGDSMVDFAPGDLMRLHRASDAVVTMTLARSDDVGRFGQVAIDDAGSVRGFVEKDQANRGPGLVNAGVYACHRALLDELPDHVPASLEREVLPHLVGAGLYGYLAPGALVDIGTPESLRNAQRDPSALLALSGPIGAFPC